MMQLQSIMTEKVSKVSIENKDYPSMYFVIGHLISKKRRQKTKEQCLQRRQKTEEQCLQSGERK
jgi:hypothetical protein